MCLRPSAPMRSLNLRYTVHGSQAQHTPPALSSQRSPHAAAPLPSPPVQPCSPDLSPTPHQGKSRLSHSRTKSGTFPPRSELRVSCLPLAWMGDALLQRRNSAL